MKHSILTMSRRSRTVRTMAASLLLAALMTAATACGSDSKTSGESSTVNAGVVEDTASGSEQTGVIETGTATTDSNETAESQPGTVDPAVSEPTSVDGSAPKQGEGTFNGLADSHSAEITTSDGTFVYQLGEGLEEQAAALAENAKIRFEYTEKAIDGGESQRWLTKIEAE